MVLCAHHANVINGLEDFWDEYVARRPRLHQPAFFQQVDPIAVLQRHVQVVQHDRGIGAVVLNQFEDFQLVVNIQGLVGSSRKICEAS